MGAQHIDSSTQPFVVPVTASLFHEVIGQGPTHIGDSPPFHLMTVTGHDRADPSWGGSDELGKVGVGHHRSRRQGFHRSQYVIDDRAHDTSVPRPVRT